MTLHIAPALHRGLTVLEMLSQAEQPVGFNQITQYLGISKSSVSRILRVLRERGYIARVPQTGRYIPGPRMANLGQRTPLIDRMRDFGTPLLDSLTNETSNTSMLLYWNGEHIQALAKKIHPISIAMQDVGTVSAQLLTSPWGWIFYQLLSVDMQKQVRKYSKVDGVKLVSMAYLNAQCLQFSQKGYMFDDQQIYTWARRLAAPVYDHLQQLVGAVVLGGNTLTISDAMIDSFGQQVRIHAQKLSQQLGYDGNLILEKGNTVDS